MVLNFADKKMKNRIYSGPAGKGLMSHWLHFVFSQQSPDPLRVVMESRVRPQEPFAGMVRFQTVRLQGVEMDYGCLASRGLLPYKGVMARGLADCGDMASSRVVTVTESQSIELLHLPWQLLAVPARDNSQKPTDL